VTFQAPGAENHPEETKTPSRTRRDRPITAPRPPAEPATANAAAKEQPQPEEQPQAEEQRQAKQQPAAEAPAKNAPASAKRAAPPKKAAAIKKAAPTKAAAAKATPAKATPTKATAKAVPAKATSATATPAKTTPAKSADPSKPATKARPAKTTAARATDPSKTTKRSQPIASKATTEPQPEIPDLAAATDLTPTPAEIITAAAEVTPRSAPTPWATLLANPGRAPELLALTAVQTLGPRARIWAAETRDNYPQATDEALSRLAATQFTRGGTVASALGALAGSYAPAALLASAAVTQAEITLHIAAAFGHDPTDPDRAADLLVIAGIYPTVEQARAAMTAKTTTLRQLAGRAATQTGAWALIKLATKYLPGTAFLTAVLKGTSKAKTAAARADAYYRRRKESQD
jgi:hypothetical protein